MDMEARQMAVEVMGITGRDLEYCAEVVEEYLEGREGEDLNYAERELVISNSVDNINLGLRDDAADVEHRADCECECAAIDGDDENPTLEWQHNRYCECDCGAAE